MKPTSWKPIFTGREQLRALAAVNEIAAAIEGETSDPSLATGSSGIAVFYAYLNEARPGHGYNEMAFSHWESAMEAARETPLSPSLYEGVVGVGWATAHLGGWFFEVDNETTGDMDALSCDHLRRRPWREDYDLIGGLVGFGVYALEQLPGLPAIECLARVIDHLDEIAERTSDGITWFTPPELLPDQQREWCPRGYYNLGVAHGVPGVIGFLAQVCSLDSKRTAEALVRARVKARHLLEGAVAWLLTQKSAGDLGSVFPCWSGPGVAAPPSRLAWCYGDLGIAVALLHAARCTGNAAWEREALSAARRAARRSQQHSGVKDSGLCHGAAGVGHIFNRLFQATGKVWLQEAARRWFRRTLRLRRPSQGIAGFSAFRLDGWANEVGILEGAAGIALGLLAAATSVEPQWDRMLLLSMPASTRHRQD